MMTVPSRELKNRLGKYLKLVREGEPVRVTDRGRPIACILPLESQKASTAPALDQLLRKGGISLGSGERIPSGRPAVLGPGKAIVQMVVEDRR